MATWRKDDILSRLRAEQREWHVEELARATGASAITIRRELEVLAREGAIIRTHGGCLYAGRMAMDVEYHGRVARNFDLKRAIGRAAAAEVHTGDTILVDDGSTCFHITSYLGGLNPVTLYTNCLPLTSEVSGLPHVRLHILGGRFDPSLRRVGGSLTEHILDELTFDSVFLGADAVNAQGQCLVQSQELARTAQCMLRRGRRKILLADHTKVSETGRVAYARLKDFDLWITTRGLPPQTLRQFRAMTSLQEAEEEKR